MKWNQIEVLELKSAIVWINNCMGEIQDKTSKRKQRQIT
jgi:hypothetical protein